MPFVITPAIATLEELQHTNDQIQGLIESYPQAMKEISAIISKNRKIGYRNICKMINGKTPKELKGLD